MTIEEEICKLRREDSEFRIAVENMRHAFEGMKFHGNVRIAKLLDETLAAVDWDCRVFESMKDGGWRKAGRNVGRWVSGPARSVIGSGGKHVGRNVGRGIVRDARGDLRTDARISSCPLKLWTTSRSRCK